MIAKNFLIDLYHSTEEQVLIRRTNALYQQEHQFTVPCPTGILRSWWVFQGDCKFLFEHLTSMYTWSSSGVGGSGFFVFLWELPGFKPTKQEARDDTERILGKGPGMGVVMDFALNYSTCLQVRKSLGGHILMPGHTAWSGENQLNFSCHWPHFPRPFCAVAKMYKPGFDRPLREGVIESKEGEIILISSLTSIPVLQNLAAHCIFGSLRTAKILPVYPEARVVFLYQVAVVPDYCYRREDEREITSRIGENPLFACFPLWTSWWVSDNCQLLSHPEGKQATGPVAHMPGPREFLCSSLQWSVTNMIRISDVSRAREQKYVIYVFRVVITIFL